MCNDYKTQLLSMFKRSLLVLSAHRRESRFSHSFSNFLDRMVKS